MSTISVPEHLWEVLLPLLKLDIGSPELQSLLREHIKEKVEDTSPEVPYELITGIAKWGQSEAGRIILGNDGLGMGVIYNQALVELSHSRSQIIHPYTVTRWHNVRPILKATSASTT